MLANYPLRAWAAGPPPVSYVDMLQLNNAINNIDGRIDTLEQRAPGLLADNHPTSSSAFSTTETVVDSWVGTLVGGRRYRPKWQAGISSSVSGATYPGGTLIYTSFRAKFTSTVDTTGTVIWLNDVPNVNSTNNVPVRNEATFMATATGTWTVVATCKNAVTGTGNVAYAASSNHRLFTLEDIGL